MYTIGRLARRARIKTDSVRFYERQGLVAPATKTPAGYRLYTDAALRRLVFIKHAQRCGLTLAEIGKLLQLHETAPAARRGVYRLAAEKKREIEKTITTLRAMSEALSSLIPSGSDDSEAADTAGREESPVLLALEASLLEQETHLQNRAQPVVMVRQAQPSLYR
jgi:DNA-binding transcriptional MerR regulator